MSAADRSGTERIRRLKALVLSKGPVTGAMDYETLQSIDFGKTPYLRQLANGAVDTENCCEIIIPPAPAPYPGYTFGFGGGGGNQAGANGVAYANGLWVAVGNAYSNSGGTQTGQNIIYSRNPAVGWYASPGFPFGIVGGANPAGLGIAYGNGLWVAVGYGADTGKTILYSTDPTTGWSLSPGTPFGKFGYGYGIAFDGSSTWVAVGSSKDANGNPDGNNILYSTDPATGWSISKGRPFGAALGDYAGPLSVTFADGIWVAVGKGKDMTANSTGDNIMYSLDAINWTASPGQPFGNGSGNGNGVTYGNGLWVATGQGVDSLGNFNGNNILYSTDPRSEWFPSPGKPFGSNVTGSGRSECTAGGVSYSNGLWAAIGLNSIDKYNVMYSLDPKKGWEKSGGLIFSAGGGASQGSGFNGAIAYGPGGLVIAGHGVNPDGTPNRTHLYYV